MNAQLRSFFKRTPRLAITNPLLAAVALLIACLLAYGLWLPRMGFYWDDWPWVWLSHVSGPASLFKIDQAHRPLAGVVLWMSYQLAGVKPLNWQILNLAYRWLGGLALFWMLGKLWPSYKSQVLWVTLLFLVYPAFDQQFVSVNSSRHILPQAFFFLSLGGMILGLRRRQLYPWLIALALALGLIAILTTEYYYGLELIRPVLIWFILDKEEGFFVRLRNTFLFWLPFLVMLGFAFIWRYRVSLSVNYPVTIIASLQTHPFPTFISSITQILKNGLLSTYSAYALLFDLPNPLVFGQLNVRLYWLLVILSTGLTALFLFFDRRQSQPRGWWQPALSLGAVSLLVGSLPFLATNIGVNLNFPQNRTLLPMMLGSSLLFVSLIDGLCRVRWAKICLVACLVGLSVGVHFKNSLGFQKDWEYQKAFFWQLTWRVPGLKPGTTLVTTDLPEIHSTDNSLTAPLNWIYANHPLSDEIPYLMLFLRLREEQNLPYLRNDLQLNTRYGAFQFNGSNNNILSFYDNYPGCVKILHPKFDARLPQLPLPLKRSLTLVNLDSINANPPEPASLPLEIFGPEPEDNWCYYFEKADLARQIGDWQKIKQLGDEAFQFAAARQKASENAPFIQGYAYVGDWRRAEELTAETLKIDPNLQPMLCLLWRDITKNASQSIQKEHTLQSLQIILNCSGN